MGNCSAFDETEVLRSLAEGDEVAFKQVYNRYWKSVYKVALRYLQSEDLAQDVVQEVFSAFWYRRTEFTQIRNIESYLVVMAQNHTYKELRKWAAEQKNNQKYVSNLEIVTDNSDHKVLTNQYEALLAEAVRLLPPQQQQVFQLAKKEGLSHEAIAAKLNLSQGTVKNHMVRALRFIRHYLAPHVGIYLIFCMLFPLDR
nr:sigma-70 family RNA polymerase sigma factor [uncultured Dyadobacter sp.]